MNDESFAFLYKKLDTTISIDLGGSVICNSEMHATLKVLLFCCFYLSKNVNILNYKTDKQYLFLLN